MLDIVTIKKRLAGAIVESMSTNHLTEFPSEVKHLALRLTIQLLEFDVGPASSLAEDSIVRPAFSSMLCLLRIQHAGRIPEKSMQDALLGLSHLSGISAMTLLNQGYLHLVRR